MEGKGTGAWGNAAGSRNPEESSLTRPWGYGGGASREKARNLCPEYHGACPEELGQGLPGREGSTHLRTMSLETERR